MKAYIALPNKLEADTSVTIEADADHEGLLYSSVTDQDLQDLLRGLVHARILRACWRNRLCVDELGLYTATVLQCPDGIGEKEDVTIKVWVVPSQS